MRLLFFQYKKVGEGPAVTHYKNNKPVAYSKDKWEDWKTLEMYLNKANRFIGLTFFQGTERFSLSLVFCFVELYVKTGIWRGSDKDEIYRAWKGSK